MKFLFLILFFSCSAFSKETFRAAVVSTLAPPLILNSKISSEGLVNDYIQAIAEELNIDIKVDLLSRLRIDSREENYDLTCYSNQTWNYHPEDFYWSKTIFYRKEIIVGNKPLPKTISDFQGEPIGTLMGYRYPALEPLFKQKKLRRTDVENEVQNFQKLVHGRISFIVADDLQMAYYRKQNSEDMKNISPVFLVESEYPIQCGIRKTSKLTLAQINHAIDMITTSGKFEKIIKSYR